MEEILQCRVIGNNDEQCEPDKNIECYPVAREWYADSCFLQENRWVTTILPTQENVKKWLFRNGQLGCDDDLMIFEAMTST